MLTITPIYIGLVALLFLWLSYRVIDGRRMHGVSLGDGGHTDLNRRIRAQANCAEYAPIGLIMVLSAELQGAAPWMVHALGLTLLAGRVAHGAGLTSARPQPMLRMSGMVLTLVSMLGGIGGVLGLAIIG